MNNPSEPSPPWSAMRHGDRIEFSGLTKREYAAIAAMQGLLAGGNCMRHEAAAYAVQQADALLAELEEKG